MSNNQVDTSAAKATTGSAEAPGIGKTRLLLQAVYGTETPEHSRLYEEVVRLNPSQSYDPSELIELSVKISPRGFSQRRHGASLSWQPSARGQLAESARKAIPSEALRQALIAPAADDKGSAPPSREESDRAQKYAALREFIDRSTRYFSALAYDFDTRKYKMYLFKHSPIHYLEEVDLPGQLADLPSLSYCRSQEVSMDNPLESTNPVYFKLRFQKRPSGEATLTAQSLPSRRPAADILLPDFSPHPALLPRLLAVPKREGVTQPLNKLLTDLVLHNDPVIKFVPPALGSSRNAASQASAEDFRALKYGVSVNLLDPNHIRFVAEEQDCILGIAEAFGCAPQAKAWLAQVMPFDCFLSYLGVGADSVTFYYRSTAVYRRQPAPQYVPDRTRVRSAR